MPDADPSPDPMNPTDPAWTGQDLTGDVHAKADKPDRVRKMFSAIAKSYDLNNRVHSLWRDQSWRKFAVQQAGVKPGETVLDCACGTGDLTRLFASTTPAKKVVGLDFTPAMLDRAREKDASLVSEGRVQYIDGDAMALPLEDASVDVISIAFGIRNVAEPAKALREFRRVLRNGGRLVVLEFDKPQNVVVRAVSNFYTQSVMPLTATLISGDRSGAYRYLPKSVEGFMDRFQMGEMILASGFQDWTHHALSMGICVCHRAVVAGAPPSSPV